MNEWLDSLSEDWPSNPLSEHNSSSIHQDNGSPKSNVSQSRIPRRSNSNISLVNGESPGGRLSVHKANSTKDALKERTPSSLNISQKSQFTGQAKPTITSQCPTQKKETRNLSPASSPTVAAGTVAFKASPTKGKFDTPEWKRRIVQGKIGPGDQTDMFGPMGIQSIFKPPTLGPRPKQTKKPDFQAKKTATNDIPSSPPTLASSPAISEPRDPAKSTSPKPAQKGPEIEEKLEGSVLVHSEANMNASQYALAHIYDLDMPIIRQQNLTLSSADSSRRHAADILLDSRNESTLDQSNSNDFTPFYVSKSHTIDGKVDYAAIDMSMKRLHSNMEKLRLSQLSAPSIQPEDEESQATGNETPGMSFRKSQMNEITSQSLPEDLSVGTDAFAANGGFVSLHRGGYSNEGSFQKRPLSPSSSHNVEKAIGNSTRGSSQALPSPHHSQKEIPRPTTPPRTPRKTEDERPRSSGSPLKLFDKYDTFTNDRLARHISRFEETQAQNETPDRISEEEVLQPSSPSPGPKASRKFSLSKNFVESIRKRSINSFGSGELDEHSFRTDEQSAAKPSLPHWSPGDQAPERLPGRKRSRMTSHGSRRTSRMDHKDSTWTPACKDIQFPGDEENVLQSKQRTQEVSYTVHGKRLPYSPVKDAARKRRRTLCSSEERKRATLAPHPLQADLGDTQAPVASASSRKRKDARYDTERQNADPQTLAVRQILRPRNPTPGQSGSSARHTPLSKSDHPHITITGYGTGGFAQSTDSASRKVDPPTQIVAGALATIALNTVQGMESGSRKASVTTSDFFNEAQQIMALIRAEKRPRSSHNSAETSNMAQSFIQEESSITDSTKDDLTRPPSREGGSMRRMQVPAQHDARVVSHLRKFEDKDELGLALPSSGRSIRISNFDVASVASPARPNDEDQDIEDESEPPNMRIRERIMEGEKPEHSSSKSGQQDSRAKTGHQKIDSQGSSGSSTGQSIPTGSSRGSANMKKIAPQSVAHLLSDQMADMFFDKERQVWIKRKVSADSASFNAEAHPLSEGTEEDLFGDIPDLSVDEMEELRRVKDVVSNANSLSLGGSTTSKHDHATQQAREEHPPRPQAAPQDVRPQTADGKIIPPADNSSAPSKYTNFAWSGPLPGTRATSYGDDVWPNKIAPQPATIAATDKDPTSPEVEHEISILEGRGPIISSQEDCRHRQPRVVTVAFSSPLIQSPYQLGEDWEHGDQSRFEDSPSKQASQLQSSAKRPTSSGFSRGQRRTSRRLSVSNSSFIARPMSRLDEHDEEMSLVHYSTKRPDNAMGMTVSTPLPLSRSLIVPPTTGQRSGLDYKLSPLPDFTIHQIDRPLDSRASVVVRQTQPHHLQEVSNVLSLTAQELVKHLTDMEPYEPYWEHLPIVRLKDRGLTSLHMLDEFCGRTQELDVSQNQIRELDGVPATVRLLNLRGNCLSDLTAWHTLLHLQYLDVSGNHLKSLRGFQSLVHVRSLKADDNEIESIDGIEHLDGLLSLSLRGNRLRQVDFEGCSLRRLEDLDLQRNSLVNVANLEALESIQTLNVSMNDLEGLHFDDKMPKLHHLDLSDNNLISFDVSAVPNLRRLLLDRNVIDHVKGLKTHKCLESLCWREQDTMTQPMLQYQDCDEIRKLYLSSTGLSSFAPQTPFLNLSTLELASTGLQALPEDFGTKCRNLRLLNLNYNAISDIRPLLSVERLRGLHLAGNRLSRLRRTAAVLDRLSRELNEVDLRNNPLTVGFYTPQPAAGENEKRVIVRGQAQTNGKDAEDYETKTARAYLLPHLDKDADNTSRERLDDDTKLRRRVYEMLLATACKSLQRLDGLEVDRSMVGRRDGVWERLVELGVLKGKGRIGEEA